MLTSKMLHSYSEVPSRFISLRYIYCIRVFDSAYVRTALADVQSLVVGFVAVIFYKGQWLPSRKRSTNTQEEIVYLYTSTQTRSHDLL